MVESRIMGFSVEMATTKKPVLYQSAKYWLIIFGFMMLLSFALLVCRVVDLQVIQPLGKVHH